MIIFSKQENFRAKNWQINYLNYIYFLWLWTKRNTMADSDREDMITQFQDVTGVPTDRATFYLESANWTLQV